MNATIPRSVPERYNMVEWLSRLRVQKSCLLCQALHHTKAPLLNMLVFCDDFTLVLNICDWKEFPCKEEGIPSFRSRNIHVASACRYARR